MSETDPLPLSFELNLEALGQAHLAAWAFPPSHPSDLLPAPWLFCIPGASYRGLAYYDRQVPGCPPSAYSMARMLARHGVGSLVIDNLGTGDSRTAIPSERLTAPVLADAYAQVIQHLRQRLQNGTLVPSVPALPAAALWLGGVGHSMGALLLVHLQGRHHPFAAVALLGMPLQRDNYTAFMASFQRHPDYQALLAQVLQNDPAAIPSVRYVCRPVFYSEAVPRELIEVDEHDATTMPLGLFHALMDPEQHIAWAARITGPVYLGFGEQEIPLPREEPAVYAAANPITLFVVPGAAHCANFEPGRLALWDDLLAWCQARATLSRKQRLTPSVC